MLKQQTETYTEMMIEAQPDIQEFPNKKLGRFTLSWYSPKELGKENGCILDWMYMYVLHVYLPRSRYCIRWIVW